MIIKCVYFVWLLNVYILYDCPPKGAKLINETENSREKFIYFRMKSGLSAF